MKPSENLLRSSIKQWRTTARLMQMAPMSEQQRRQICTRAQKARSSLERGLGDTRCSESRSRAAEELAQILDSVIDGVSDESKPKIAVNG